MTAGILGFGRLWPVVPGQPEDEATPVGLAPGQMPVDPRRDGSVQPTTAGKKLSGAIGGVAGGMAQSLLDAAKLPADVYAGRVDPMSDQGIGRAFDLAGTLATGGMPMAEAGAAGIFGGRLSRTANKEALAEAQEQAAMGIGRKDIWNETGWFQGPDKQWLYEIPDQATRYSGQGPKLGHGFDHPELYAAYPDLKAANLAVKDSLPDDVYGLYYFNRRQSPERIEVARTSRGEAIPRVEQHNTTLHEAQHAIQAREGSLTRAATREMSPEEYAADLKERVLNGYRLKGDEGTADAFQRWKDDQYWRSPQEVEARNVERRRTWSDAERQSVPPWESADVPWPQPGPQDAYPLHPVLDEANPVIRPFGALPR